MRAWWAALSARRRRAHGSRAWCVWEFYGAARFSKGQEMGWFQHGSTIIVFAPRGFTLVEVLVALIIVALGSAAMLSALASSARAAERIRERMIAGFVAMNRLTETRLEPEFPGVGRREGQTLLGPAFLTSFRPFRFQARRRTR